MYNDMYITHLYVSVVVLMSVSSLRLRAEKLFWDYILALLCGEDKYTMMKW